MFYSCSKFHQLYMDKKMNTTKTEEFYGQIKKNDP